MKVAVGRSTRDTIALAVGAGILLAEWVAARMVELVAWLAGLTGLDAAAWAPAGTDAVVFTVVAVAVFDVAVIGLWRGVKALGALQRGIIGRRWPGLLGPSLRHSVIGLLLPALLVAGWPLLTQTAADAVAAIGRVPDPAPCAPPDLQGDAIAGYGPEQFAVAATIVQVGQEMGVPERGRVVAVATAMQESGLDPAAVGDGGQAHGPFQQHPSWASLAERHDTASSARRFYERLLKVSGWADLPLWQAAQAVQRSGFPTAYAKHEAIAAQLVGAAADNPCTSGRT